MTDAEILARETEAAMLLADDRLVEVSPEGDGEGAALAVSSAAPHDPSRHPIRLLADMPERWIVTRPRGRGAHADRGITWTEARERIEAHARADGERADIGAGALDRLAVDYDARGLLHTCKTVQVRGELRPGGAPVPLRLTAYRQLAARAGAPAGYLARLPAGLARACLSHGLTHSGASRDGLIRLAGGEARAIVSSAYGVADDGLVLDTVEQALAREGILSDVRVAALAVGPRTIVRLTIPGLARRVGPPEKGDVIEGMLDVSNGETGLAAFRAVGGVYRLVCTNGMVRADVTDRRAVRHHGDPRRIAEAIADSIPAALSAATGAVDLLARATERVVARASDAFAGLRLFGAHAAEVRAAADMAAAHRGTALPAEGEGRRSALDALGLTAWDVVQATTEAAQALSVERRTAMEAAAGAWLGSEASA